MSCIKEQQGWDASPKMGAKRVSDTIRLENLLLKGRDPSGASPLQQIYLINLAPFFCAQIIHEETLIISFLSGFVCEFQARGRWSLQAELRASAGRHCR